MKSQQSIVDEKNINFSRKRMKRKKKKELKKWNRKKSEMEGMTENIFFNVSIVSIKGFYLKVYPLN